MSLSAVSWVCAVAIAAGPDQVQKATLAESDAFRNVRRSVVTLQSGGVDRGIGVCIDESGSVLVHRAMVGFPVLFARYGNGQVVQMRLQATDETTQLALLKAAHPGNWLPTVPKIAEEPAKPYGSVFAIIPGGAIQCEVVSNERLGVFDPSRRAVPLIELKFEAPLLRVGGSPVFTKSGELVGFLSATLPNAETERVRQEPRNAVSGVPPVAKSVAQYGPTGLTVGYAIGPIPIARVFEGFRSPDPVVRYAALGVLIAEAGQNGVEIRDVLDGSAAAQAGLKVGDIIFEIAGTRIRNQIEYTKAMMSQTPGAAIDLKFTRGGEAKSVKVTPKT